MYSKRAVAYEHPAKGKDHCGECKHFRSPASCEIVEGRIAPEDWCRLFVKVKKMPGLLTYDARK